MKKEYDLSKGVRGKFASRVPPDAVFVMFDGDVGHLLAGPGSFADRVRSLARSRKRVGRAPAITRSVALSPTEYRALKPVLDRLGARVFGDEAWVEARLRSEARRRKAG